MVGKGENAGNQYFSSFLTVFSTLPKTSFNFSVTFILSSANSSNSDQSKIFSLGKENDKILVWYKLEAFADDKLKFAQIMNLSIIG